MVKFSACYLLFTFFLLSILNSQPLAVQLGHKADTKLLIVHADDLGVAHSVNSASIEAFEKGGITSASIMVPCPWFPEIAEYAAAHPEFCWGLHLTLTAEWKNYKWDGVASSDKISSLLNDQNLMYDKVIDIVTNCKLKEVEIELRAQIERALSYDVPVSHLDSHMGTLFSNEDLFKIYLSLGNEFNLPILIPGGRVPESWEIEKSMNQVQHPVDNIMMMNIEPDDTKQAYNKMIDSCVPGLNELIIHLGHDNSELKAVMIDHPNFGSTWRENDLNYVLSQEFRDRLAANNIVLTSWKEIRNVSLK